MTVPELPGRAFRGRVARNASALAANTRTLLTEVDVENADGALTAGLYGIVHLQEPRLQPVIMIPSEAVIFNKDGLSAAVLEDGRVRVPRPQRASRRRRAGGGAGRAEAGRQGHPEPAGQHDRRDGGAPGKLSYGHPNRVERVGGRLKNWLLTGGGQA